MKAKDLREKAGSALQGELIGLLREQFNLRMQKGTGQLSQPHKLNEVRKDIARVKTVMNEQKVSKAS